MRGGCLMRRAALMGSSDTLRRCMLLGARSGRMLLGSLLRRGMLSARSGRMLDAGRSGVLRGRSPCDTGRWRVMRSRHAAPLRGMRLTPSLGRVLAGNPGIVA